MNRDECENPISQIGIGMLLAVLMINCHGNKPVNDHHELCRHSADSSIAFENDAYEKSLDSLVQLAYRDVPESTLEKWSIDILHAWFRKDNPRTFWSQVDSSLHVTKVLFSCESGSVDGPGYHCSALVCVEDGLAVVGYANPTLAQGQSIVYRVISPDPSTEKWLGVALNGLDSLFKLDQPEPLDSHMYGLAVLRIDGGEKTLMHLTRVPHCPPRSLIDSLYCFIQDNLEGSESR